jgi:hypothetical protein
LGTRIEARRLAWTLLQFYPLGADDEVVVGKCDAGCRNSDQNQFEVHSFDNPYVVILGF